LLLPLSLSAQPAIFPNGIVSAASYLSPGSPGGALAQGSIFTIFGNSLGPAAPGAQASGFPLSPTLAGVSVRVVHQTGQTLPALPLFVSATQINAILPSTTPIGLVLLSVLYEGRASNAEPVKVVRSSFGIFARNSGGSGRAVAQNAVSATELPLNSPETPAVPGDIVVLWGTGLGPAESDQVRPQPAERSEPLEILVAGRPAAVLYRGRSGCCAGVDQINMRLPPETPSGCAVPVVVQVNGLYSNLVTLAIGPGGRPCQDSWSPPGGARRWGEIVLTRAGGSDLVDAVFAEGEAAAGLPPPGTCASSGPLPAAGLDAGAQLSLAGPQGMRQIPRQGPGRYRLASTGSSPFLGAGVYGLSGPGGADVGPFQTSLTAAAFPAWGNPSGTRDRGVTMGWTGATAGEALLAAGGPGFVCAAIPGSGSFTIPPEVLANAPAQVSLTLDAMFRTNFTSPGLDFAVLRYADSTSRGVNLGDPPLAASPVRLPNGQTIVAELAATAPERQRGLMQRSQLASDRGMLFLFDRPDFYPFWMYRTVIPLDIIWLDSNRRIVFVSPDTPPCRSEDSRQCPTYGGREVAQYVLEVAAGVAARQGLRVGDRLEW